MSSVAIWCCGFDPDGILSTVESGEWLQPFFTKTGELIKCKQWHRLRRVMRQRVTDSELPADINIYKQIYAHQYVLEGLRFQFVIHL